MASRSNVPSHVVTHPLLSSCCFLQMHSGSKGKIRIATGLCIVSRMMEQRVTRHRDSARCAWDVVVTTVSLMLCVKNNVLGTGLRTHCGQGNTAQQPFSFAAKCHSAALLAHAWRAAVKEDFSGKKKPCDYRFRFFVLLGERGEGGKSTHT